MKEKIEIHLAKGIIEQIMGGLKKSNKK